MPLYVRKSGQWSALNGSGTISAAYGDYKPTASNTGPTVSSLVQQSGDLVVTTDGAVIENLDLAGRIIRKANNVTVRNCIIRGLPAGYSSGNTAMIDANPTSFTGLRIQDCTLIPQTPTVYVNGLIGNNFIAERCNIYNCVDGGGSYFAGAANVEVYGCFIHDMYSATPDPNHTSDGNGGHTHNDGWQHQGGTGLKLVGNVFQDNEGPASTFTSANGNVYSPSAPGQALLLGGNVAATTGALINKNWFYYGTQGITIVLPSSGTGTNVGTITGNRFGRNQYTNRPIIIHPTMSATGFPTSTGLDTNNGNVYEDNGSPITITVSSNY